MNTVQQGLTVLLRSAITGEALALPADFRLEDASELIRDHSISTLAYLGAVYCGISRSSPAMEQLFSVYGKALMLVEGQERELRRIFEAFEAAGVDHIPLKGCKMRPLYPSPELRLMGDADVLIRVEEYPRTVPPVLEKLGFTFRSESDHELVWTTDKLYLELHKHLIPSYNPVFYSYFGDGWQLAQRQSGSRWMLPPEDEMIFLFTHFAKHYRDGGIGCRHVVDLWVFLRSEPTLDEGRIRQELDKMGLAEFYDNIRRLIRTWFEDGPADDVTEFLTQYIFSSGNFGSMDSKTIAHSIRDLKEDKRAGASRVHYFFYYLFPPSSLLADKYTVLKKHPWTLPFVWVYRMVVKLLFDRKALKRHGRNLTLINQENLDQQRQMLRYVGLTDTF